jgi:tripartite-type tricarboxylate transporter receptor subunit TctC
MADQGVPGFSALAWWGVIAPAATPPALVKRMHEELAKALKSPAVREKLTSQGMDIDGGGPRSSTSSCEGRSRDGPTWSRRMGFAPATERLAQLRY